MLHLRIVSPRDRSHDVLAALSTDASVVHIAHLPGVSRKPGGDLILCDVAREDASLVIDALRDIGITEVGAISLDTTETTLSVHADRATELAAGAPADAVVWEQVVSATSEEAELSVTFVGFMIVATLIAAVGIITDSPILIVGAMVVGPEFGPLAGLAVALVQRRGAQAWASMRALLVGFPLAIVAAGIGTALFDAFGSLPESLDPGSRPLTGFISNPDEFTFVVALLAGVAGTLSLTSAKSGALVGVLISVTTIPAASDIGVSAAVGEWTQTRGATGQLLANLTCIVAASVVTLTIQRAATRQRQRRREAMERARALG